MAVYREQSRTDDRRAKLYFLLGFPERTYRRRAVQALRLQPGDTAVDICCGTGPNFSRILSAIGTEGQVVGVDLTDGMLAHARRRVEAQGWSNVALVQSDALDWQFPSGVDAVLCTLGLSLIPECAEVIARGAAALAPGGRWAVMDVKVPDGVPGWLRRGELTLLRQYGLTPEWMAGHWWETVHAAMQAYLSELTWSDEFFGFANIAAGTRQADDPRLAR